MNKEDEDALVEKNVRSLHALANQNNESIGSNTARSIAFGMALATLKARETERLLCDIFTEDRKERRAIQARDTAGPFKTPQPNGAMRTRHSPAPGTQRSCARSSASAS